MQISAHFAEITIKVTGATFYVHPVYVIYVYFAVNVRM